MCAMLLPLMNGGQCPPFAHKVRSYGDGTGGN